MITPLESGAPIGAETWRSAAVLQPVCAREKLGPGAGQPGKHLGIQQNMRGVIDHEGFQHLRDPGRSL